MVWLLIITYIALSLLLFRVPVYGVSLTSRDFPHGLDIGPNSPFEGDTSTGHFDYLQYGGLVTYNKDTKDLFDDDALWGLVWQAYIEMQESYDNLREICGFQLGPQTPSVMSAVAIGNEVYFASSLRGSDANDFLYVTLPDSAITAELNRCQVYEKTARRSEDTDLEHRRGICGEIFATAMYMRKHGDSPRKVTGREGPATIQNARVVSWGVYPNEDLSKQGHAINPCSGKDNEWGCRQFMNYEGFKMPNSGIYLSNNRNRNPPISDIKPERTQMYGIPIDSVQDPMDMDTAPG